MSEALPSRRRFLVTAVLTAGVLNSGCSNGESNTALVRRKVEPLDPQKSYPNPDSIFRAATIRLRGENGRGTASFLQIDSNYYLYTVGHVADDLKEGNLVYAEVKGLDRFKIDPSRFATAQRLLSAQIDHLAFYPLKGDDLAMLLEEVEKQRLAPLVFASNKPGAYENILIPRIDTDMFEKFRVLDYSSEVNAYDLISTTDSFICEGMSGSAVIRTRDGVITNEVYGVVSSMFTKTLDARESDRSGRICGFAGLFVPNLYPNHGLLPQF